jgi:acetyl-CoA carboxylase biotin carboxyl carrier protein
MKNLFNIKKIQMKEYDMMVTIKEIQKMIKDFEKSELTELELEYEEVKLKLSKNTYETKSNVEVANPQTIEENIETVQPKTSQDIEVKSPLVGTFYRSESPTTKPFVEMGQVVHKGDVLCIIEAMKIMNEITAPSSGKITSILLEDKDVVSFDQVLMTIGKVDEA